MTFDPIHIHKTKNNSHQNILFLFIPILIFTLIVTYFVYTNTSFKIAQSNDQTSVLGETTSTLDRLE